MEHLSDHPGEDVVLDVRVRSGETDEPVDEDREGLPDVLDLDVVPARVGLDRGLADAVDDGVDGAVDEARVERGVLDAVEVLAQRVGGVEVAAEERDALEQRTVGVAGHALGVPHAHAHDELVDDLLEDDVDECVLVGEVVVDQAARDPDLVGDVLEGRAGEPAAAEDGARGGDDLAAPLVGGLARPRRTGRRGGGG